MVGYVTDWGGTGKGRGHGNSYANIMRLPRMMIGTGGCTDRDRQKRRSSSKYCVNQRKLLIRIISGRRGAGLHVLLLLLVLLLSWLSYGNPVVWSFSGRSSRRVLCFNLPSSVNLYLPFNINLSSW